MNMVLLSIKVPLRDALFVMDGYHRIYSIYLCLWFWFYGTCTIVPNRRLPIDPPQWSKGPDCFSPIRNLPWSWTCLNQSRVSPLLTSALTQDGAYPDISANGLWGGRYEKTFFDVQVFNPYAPSNRHPNLASVYKRHKDLRRRAYWAENSWGWTQYIYPNRIVRPSAGYDVAYPSLCYDHPSCAWEVLVLSRVILYPHVHCLPLILYFVNLTYLLLIDFLFVFFFVSLYYEDTCPKEEKNLNAFLLQQDMMLLGCKSISCICMQISLVSFDLKLMIFFFV